MNILLIEPLGDGGIAHYTLNLATALAQKKNNIKVFTSKDYEFEKNDYVFETLNKMFKASSYLINHFPGLAKENGFPSAVRRFIKLLEYPLNTIEALYASFINRVDIVHFQSVNEIEILMVLAFKLFGSKNIFTIHNIRPRHGELRWYHFIIYRTMYQLCDHLIIHSNLGKNEIVDLFSIDPSKISVIPHGNYKFFKSNKAVTLQQAKSTIGIPITCKTLLFFGAIRPNKGLDCLLHALPTVKNTISNFKLLIVGEPCENYNKYTDIIYKEGLEKYVYEKLDYIPFDEVELYFLASDIVVLPYKEVTQSGVLQIAYAFSKPVIATSVCGFTEAVENNHNGYLIPPNNTKALADKIILLLNDENKINAMGNYSRHLSDTKYSWDTIASQTLNVYKHYV